MKNKIYTEREKNLEKRKQYQHKYYLENKNRLNEQKKNYYREHKIEHYQRQIEYEEECKELCYICHNNNNFTKLCRYHRDKLYKDKNKEHLKIKDREYEKKNKDIINLKRRLKYKTNITYKLSHLLSSRLRQAITTQDGIKKNKTHELTGCTINFLINHLESQFNDEMSWKNYKYYGWHIDHKTSCSKFDLKELEQQKQCFHYSNLQPMWGVDNMSKGAR